MALTPFWPKAGPIGGVGVAPPDGIVNFKYEITLEAAPDADFFPDELIITNNYKGFRSQQCHKCAIIYLYL